MNRYVFYCDALTPDPQAVSAAKKTARSLGVTVLKSVAGSLLLEAAPTHMAALAKALPGWRYSVDTRSHRIPERTPLQRVRVAGAKGG